MQLIAVRITEVKSTEEGLKAGHIGG